MESNPNNAMKGIVSQLTLAGAAALCGTAAHAQVVVTSVNENVGFASGDHSSYTVSLPGASIDLVNRSSGPSTAVLGIRAQNAYIRATLHSVMPALANAGQVWSTIGGGINVGNPIATADSLHASPLFTDKYYAFRFNDSNNGNKTEYGWIEVSLTNNTVSNLTLHIDSYAYDKSGNPISMGDTVSSASSVPEPSAALALAAFSTLTLGAVGVKRFKTLQN